MKTMWLDDGDFVIGSSSDYQMITNASKVKQDLRGALLEPLGNDRFHRGWGSSLSDFVSQPLTSFLRMGVLAEVNRVIGNYAAVQRDQIEADMYSESTSRFSTDEIISSVIGVETKQHYDSLGVTIGVSTVAGSTLSVSEVL